MNSDQSERHRPNRIYLRLITADQPRLPEAEQILHLQMAVNQTLRIEWTAAPAVHLRGGYTICGVLPDDLDLAAALIQLREHGYLAVF
jgi:hypothetical protein